MRRFFSPLWLLLLLLIPLRAEAGIVGDAINFVSGGGGFGVGSNGLVTYVDIARFLGAKAWLMVGTVALYNVSRAGLKLINSEDDGKLQEAKNSITYSLVGTMLAFLAPRFVEAFVLACDGGDCSGGVAILTDELLGIVRWSQGLVVIVSIGIIVASGAKAIANFGKEDSVADMRQAVFGVAGGIILMAVSGAILLTFGLEFGSPPTGGNPMPIIARALSIVSNLMLFLAMIATVVIVYAGLRMILNLGDEGQFQQARSLIIRALIGLVVVFVSFLAVSFVVRLFL